jgi:hypothetical protein
MIYAYGEFLSSKLLSLKMMIIKIKLFTILNAMICRDGRQVWLEDAEFSHHCPVAAPRSNQPLVEVPHLRRKLLQGIRHWRPYNLQTWL